MCKPYSFYLDNTEVLTNHGWKLIKDLLPKDKVLEWNTDLVWSDSKNIVTLSIQEYVIKLENILLPKDNFVLVQGKLKNVYDLNSDKVSISVIKKTGHYIPRSYLDKPLVKLDYSILNWTYKDRLNLFNNLNFDNLNSLQDTKKDNCLVKKQIDLYQALCFSLSKRFVIKDNKLYLEPNEVKITAEEKYFAGNICGISTGLIVVRQEGSPFLAGNPY